MIILTNQGDKEHTCSMIRFVEWENISCNAWMTTKEPSCETIKQNNSFSLESLQNHLQMNYIPNQSKQLNLLFDYNKNKITFDWVIVSHVIYSYIKNMLPTFEWNTRRIHFITMQGITLITQHKLIVRTYNLENII